MEMSRCRIVILTVSLLLSFVAPLGATLEQEADLRQRIRDVVADGSLADLDNVYLRADSPALAQMLVTNGFESMITRGIKVIRFHELFPIMAQRARDGFDINGAKYLPALEPYGMITVELDTTIEGAPAGHSWIVGLQDDRLYITGFVKKES